MLDEIVTVQEQYFRRHTLLCFSVVILRGRQVIANLIAVQRVDRYLTRLRDQRIGCGTVGRVIFYLNRLAYTRQACCTL